MNTHAKAMMDLLQIIKYAVKLKKIPAAKMVELEFDARHEETDSIYLTESEILQLLEIKDFDDPIHERVRNVFVVGCFTVTYGRELRELVDMKFNYLQTHSTRRSFCSNEYLKG